jgi:hypothetical protein
MWLWIFAFILTLIGFVIYGIIKSMLDKHFSLKDPTLSTPLKAFKETAAIDNRLVTRARRSVTNISEAYERMCVLDPLEYKDDPSIPGIIEQYKKLLRGELLDSEGRHVPSEFLMDKRNPDYDAYIRAQANAQGSKLRKEARRLKASESEEDMRADFTAHLLEMNFPVDVLSAVLTEQKLNKYKAEDWKKLARQVKLYCEKYPSEFVAEFLETFSDLRILFDAEKMHAYFTYRQYSVPVNVVTEIVRGRITVKQAERILKLGIDDSYSWEEAVKEVLEEDAQADVENKLRAKYRRMTKA